MIRSSSRPIHYQSLFTNGQHFATSDTSEAKGGSNLGFMPHELLEAALGCCMNMYMRMYAELNGIPLDGVSVTVTLDRTDPEAPLFEYGIEVEGSVTADQRQRLFAALEQCPVRKVLAKASRFEQTGT